MRAHQQENTLRVVAMLMVDFGLRKLEQVVDAQTTEMYRRLLPRHAELCEINQTRPLDEQERCDLAVSYASLYPTFGDDGIVAVAAAWLATKPYRQAANS